jgi:hypothetical protein
MIVKELIERLNKIENKELSVTLIIDYPLDKNGFVSEDFDADANQWLFRVNEIATGSSGYEYEGEVQLVGGE